MTEPALDITGLTPLDTSDLQPLDATGLRPLDISGLTPLDSGATPPLARFERFAPPEGLGPEVAKGQLVPPAPEPQPEAIGALDTAGRIGGQIVDAALYHLPAAVAAAVEGDEPFADRGFGDTLIERSRARSQERMREAGTGPSAIPGIPRESIAQLGPSLGFSGVGAAGGLGAGLSAAALTTPVSGPGGVVAGVVAGGGASGVLAYRMATNQFVRDLRDAADEENRSQGMQPLSDEEFNARAAALAPLIREYGLWEAVPEAASNVLGFGILKAPVKGAIGSIFGNNVATRLATKGAGLYGSELATETITQHGQHNVEHEAGLKPGEQPRSWTSPSDLGESFQEVAPVTVLQTTLMGGTVKGGQMLAARRGAQQQGQPAEALSTTDQTVVDDHSGPPGAPPPGAIPADSVLPQAPTDDWVSPADPPEVARALELIRGLPQEGPPQDTGRDPDQLRRLFDDPRTADEIRAEMEAVKNWRPTAEWQELPRPMAESTEPVRFFQGDNEVPLEIRREGDRALARIRPPEGSREAPVRLQTPDDVSLGAEQTAQPTPAQAEAGNYQKRHLTWSGLDISIETEAGQERTGIGADGRPWSARMPVPYGYIKRTEGKDGDQVDVYIGRNPQSDTVYVVDQVDPDTQRFDEHKVIIGAVSRDEAEAIYNAAFSDGSGNFRAGAVTEMSSGEFKTWLRDGNTRRPLAYQNPRTPSKPTGPLSLFQFLASKGGIQDQGGELAALGLDRAFVPGYGRLVRPTGLKLDQAREAIVEAYYLRDHGDHTGGTARTTVADLLELLDQEGRGQRVYAEPDLAAAAERQDAQARRREAARLQEATSSVREAAKAEGLNVNDDEIAAAAQQVVHHNADPLDALVDIVERSALADHDELVEIEQSQGAADGRQDEAAAADQTRAELPQARQQSVGAQSEAAQERASASVQPDGGQPDRGEAVAPDRIVAERPSGDERSGATERPGGAAAGAERDQPAAGRDAGGLTEPVTVRTEIPHKGTPIPQGDVDLKVNTPEPKAPEAGPSDSEPAVTLAKRLVSRIKSGRMLRAKELQELATEVYGGRLAEGTFDRKEIQDALELAVNMVIRDDPNLRVASADWQHPIATLSEMLSRLPTQRVRSEEMERFQQFSTPPNYAAAAAYVANLRDGDMLLEPSAGTGSLVAAASRNGVTVVANELSERRATLLRALIGDDRKVFAENAEQLNNVLPKDVRPTVVVMNPPFSQTAGRMGDRKMPMVAANHVEQALKRLAPGGRLVAIVNGGFTMGAPAYRTWWTKIGESHAIRANIGVDGKVYEKYGTTFGTRILVIDKVAPTGERPILTEARTVDDLMRILEPIRNGRPAHKIERIAAEPQAAQHGGDEVAEGRRSEQVAPAPSQSGAFGADERGGGRVVGEPAVRAGGSGERPVGVGTGQRDGVAADQSQRPGQGRAGSEPIAGDRASGQSGASRGDGAQRDLEPAASRQSGPATSSERVELEHAAPATQAATSEISESLYQSYKPQHVRVKGAKPHPGPLVESAALSSVDRPKPTYRPSLPSHVIERGLLSDAQLEEVVYAGQAHQKMLPAQDGEPEFRQGYFIGDGTGVGKGREVAGIILDNWQQGRTKAAWVSEKRTLINDAKRDWSGLGQNPALIFDVGKVKAGEKIDIGRGIGFITYDTLKGGMSDQAALARGAFIRKQKVQVNGQEGTIQKVVSKGGGRPADIVVNLANGTQVTVPEGEVTALEGANVRSRVDQIVEWFGADFDGVIAFDEAHNMGNAMSVKAGRGMKEAAQKALAGVELQRRLPNARVVYVSATGATEVSNLAYAERLGLWGRGTPFASRDKFVSEIEKGGVAAMELVARDMKSLGLYTARNLSYDGVEYERIEHKLDAHQREIYDTLAEAWQGVLANINKALELTEGEYDGRAKGAAYSAFWGAHQRFFNQIVSSMQMPSVIKAVERDLAEGRQAVLQLTNTNEASQERAAAKAQTAEDIEDLDITPRDQIIQLVERSFPTQQYEEYIDDDGKKRARPVVDSQGRPVQNEEAVAMREALIERLASIRVPQGPLDLVLDHFGIENVAEVTGRGRRFVMKEDSKTGERRRMEESRPGSSNIAEADAFQAGKKKVLIFSEAGGTGRSYHADNTAASKDARRAHYLVQGGWRADKAVQGFGRTHRTNQASAPIFRLVTTDLRGQKRFISSIARRLGQLGALTKGQRQAGDQGVFSARDNLESTEAREALRQFLRRVVEGDVEGVAVEDFEAQTGLMLRYKDDEGRVLGSLVDNIEITQFLNRLLSLKIDMQNAVFDAFAQQLDAVIEARAQAGLLDVGLETIRADKIEKQSEHVVHKIEGTDAETKHVKFTISKRFQPADFDAVGKNRLAKIAGYAKSPQGRVYVVLEAPHSTDAATGKIIDQYRIVSPISDGRIVERQAIDKRESKWERVTERHARALWQKETEAAPEFIDRDLNLITGAILPIWDRLTGPTRVVRLRTDQGEQFLGRVIPNSQMAATLQKLGAEGEQQATDAKTLFARLMAGARAELANGWVLKRSLVAGEQRIELIGPQSYSESQEAKGDGVFIERIEYKMRYFVPVTPEQGKIVLDKLTKYRPVSEITDRGAPAGLESGAPAGWDRVEPGPEQKYYIYHDLGPFPIERGAPLGRQAQDFVLERGRLNGDEHILAFTASGKVLAHGRGTHARVGVSPELRTALADPTESVVVHHNHPSDSALSGMDIASLGAPGMHAIWAHGHEGAVSRAELTPQAKRALDGLSAEQRMRRLYEIGQQAQRHFQDRVRTAVLLRDIPAEDANRAHNHLLNMVLRDAGIIEYRSNIDESALILKLNLDPYLQRGARIAAESFFNAKPEATSRADRRAEPLRHVGDLGTSLGGPEEAAGRPGAQTRNDTNRRTNDRAQEARTSIGLAAGEDLFKTEIVETVDGPREQAVIPGAEKITNKELAERRARERKGSTKPQKTVDGLPLFDGEPDPELPLFELREEPHSYEDRQRVSQGFLARGQYLDRAIRMPFDWFGGLTPDGKWKPGQRLYDGASRIITGARFAPDGRFSFINPILEAARSGLIDRYGLRNMPDYVERERGRALDERAVMLQGAEVLKTLKDHAVGPAEAKVLQAILTGEAVSDGDMAALAEPIRAAVDQLGQEAVALGLVSPESFERNRGTYLHRVYKKYEADQNGLVRMVNAIMGAQRKKIIGNQLKGRGIFEEIELSRLMKDVPDWHDGGRGKPENGEKFVMLDELSGQGGLALDENQSREKVLRRVWWPADRAIPDRYSGFRNQGEFEVRGSRGSKLTLWRDFTKDERTRMGEILDARYTIAKTFMLMAHDLSVGKFYKDIAENEAWTRSGQPEANAVDAAEWQRQHQRAFKRGTIEWVRVPTVEIPDTGGKKRWGALAGKWVREEIWRDLNELDIMSTPHVWRSLLTQWKLNKALALDTPIPTPGGWTTMGNIRVGDEVFDDHGHACTVLEVKDVQHGRPCFEVAFSDGTKIVADDEHWWFVVGRNNQKGKVLTTAQIRSTLKERTRGDNNHGIPVASSLVLPNASLPLHPYALGLWLGDGHSTSPRITAGGKAVAEIEGYLAEVGVFCGKRRQDKRSSATTFTIDTKPIRHGNHANGFKGGLVALGVLGAKHLPPSYLRASIEQRRALLQGLMDSDGWITDRGTCGFGTSIPKLRDGVLELLRSLGLKPTVSEIIPICRGKAGKKTWRIHFQGYADTPVCRLSSKASRQRGAPKTNQRSMTRMIVSITSVPSVPVRCIAVSSASHLYLAGEGMIPTHNTARSPVVHMNNVISNFVLMDMIDVRMQDFVGGIRSFVKGDAHYQEALKHGAFGADMMTQEIRDQVLKPILEELERNNTFQQGGRLGMLGQVSKFTELLWSKLKALDQKMVDLYRVEDELFRMASYIRRRELGDDPKQAAQVAREQFIDYDIRAPWINTARNTVLPFISYTYRAAPLVARAVATRPWKLGKYFLLAYALNALAYSLTGGDEDRERKSLRDREQGKTWLGTPQMLRMPVNDRHGNPIFLDVRRWVPAGDIFDMGDGDVLPAWLNLGGPLMIGAELFLNRSAFTGQEIRNNRSQDWWQRRGNDIDHLYKSWMPSAAWVPGSWYWERIATAMRGGTDRQGRPYDIGTAAASSVGIKLKPHDVEDARAMQGAEFQRVERALRERAQQLGRQRQRNIISEGYFNRQMNGVMRNMERLREKAAETLR